MNFDDLELRCFFAECYEELVIERVNEKLKSWSEGLDDALDQLEKDIEDERQE